ncbi:MAG: hypothetical protein IPJ61_19345 [Tessaracoccus sp.]|uniref:hypothetical protein n=1 Tax=Tessaracoccus sp. TaxID=1971211 RepID=UPI001ECB560D|nr:hypothetical protein [Tessaracoccus sp.]MBK7823143.1 hypothetical protein [Tessaracoccus sp.]
MTPKISLKITRANGRTSTVATTRAAPPTDAMLAAAEALLEFLSTGVMPPLPATANPDVLPVLRPLDANIGEHMTWEEFAESVKEGDFIDDDGFGDLATATHYSSVSINPSDITEAYARPAWATHVVWYNK